MKVEAWLRIADLDYEIYFEDDPRKAPLGKLPSIVDEGQVVPDSAKIIAHLDEKYKVKIDDHLNEVERSVSHAFQRMMEERLYWACVYNRWVDTNWATTRAAAFGKLPPILNMLIPAMVQRKIKRDLEGQGLGRHSRQSIYEFAAGDIDALANYLGDKPYFMGDQVSTVDAVLLSFLCGIVQSGLPSPMREKVRQHENLVAYNERLGRAYFPDFY